MSDTILRMQPKERDAYVRGHSHGERGEAKHVGHRTGRELQAYEMGYDKGRRLRRRRG